MSTSEVATCNSAMVEDVAISLTLILHANISSVFLMASFTANFNVWAKQGWCRMPQRPIAFLKDRISNREEKWHWKFKNQYPVNMKIHLGIIFFFLSKGIYLRQNQSLCLLRIEFNSKIRLHRYTSQKFEVKFMKDKKHNRKNWKEVSFYISDKKDALKTILFLFE